MGKEDIQVVDYFEDNQHFADLANGYMFQGKQIIDPQKLREANKELAYTHSEKGNKVTRDNVKRYYGNTLICVYVLEHQSNIDYHMVLRNMLSEALEYDRQWHIKQKLHKEKKDLKTSHELISGMKKEERFIPVITLVAYYGQDRWDAATCLHDLLEFEGMDDSLQKYVENFHIHVFDYHDYDNFDMFHTELRQIFSFLKCSNDKQSLKKMIAEHKEEYYNMSDESVELIATLTKSRKLLRVDRYQNEEGGTDMCKALDDIWKEGGTDKLKELIQKKLAKGKSIAEIAEALEEEESTIEALIKEL